MLFMHTIKSLSTTSRPDCAGTVFSDYYTNGTYTLQGAITLNIFPTSANTIDRTSAHA